MRIRTHCKLAANIKTNVHSILQKFKQKGREEQCEPDEPARAAKVGDLLGVDPELMMKAFCKPKIRVGTEWVTKVMQHNANSFSTVLILH